MMMLMLGMLLGHVKDKEQAYTYESKRQRELRAAKYYKQQNGHAHA